MAQVSALVRAVRLGWLDKISDVPEAPPRDIRSWIGSGNFSFLVEPQPKGFQIFVPDGEHLTGSFAFDANRMSTSAFESVLSIAPVRTVPRSLGWFAIKSYYAAFFAAHAFLRLEGISCTQLDTAEVSRLAAVAQAYGFGSARNLASGFYTLMFDSAQRTLRFDKAASGGGSHETLWLCYLAAIRDLAKKTERSDILREEKKVALDKFGLLAKILTNMSHGGGSWLSHMRNQINYRHHFGVWFPHSHLHDADSYFRLIKSIFSRDPVDNELSEQEDLDAFIKVCMFIVNLTRATILDMAAVCDGRSFQEDGPLPLLRLGRMAA